MWSKKKIAFVITKSNFGGAQRYVFDLATSLPRETYDVVVIYGPTQNGTEGVLGSMLKERGVRTILVPELTRDYRITSDARALAALVRLFRAEKPDVVHVNSSKAAGLGSLAARIARVPRICFTAHGWPFWEKRGIVWVLAARLFSWLTVVLAHTTICISHFDRRSVAWMPFVQSKFAVIYNGISEIDFLSPSDARQALFAPQVTAQHLRDRWLVTNAELHPNKNLFTAIDAVALHNEHVSPKIFYAIMGDGELRDALGRYIEKKGLSDSVVLLGFVPDGRRYLRAFDGFLLTSKKEGVPYVLLEAGSAGLPVVASNVGGIPEVIPNPQTGILVDPYDVDGIAEALRALSDPANVQLGSTLRDHVRSRFSLARMIDETVKLYS